MAIKNTLKTYVENGYYHLYNRGIDKRDIFLEPQDCVIFLHYLKLYLSSPESLLKNEGSIMPRLLYKITNLNLFNEVNLLSFALMPNHFHLQIMQKSINGIEKLTRRVLPGYVQFFNRKYKRKGPLFESTYKAVMTENEPQHLYLSSYIHRNPMKLIKPKFDFIQFSSYPYYIGGKQASWVKPQEILLYFRSIRNITSDDVLSYQNFVETVKETPEYILGDLTIDID